MVGAVCLLLSSTVYAEDLKSTDANIVGHVIEKSTREHLPYMTVSLKGTTIGTMTDATGHYFLKNLPEGEFTLSVSAVGYKSQERKVVLKRGKTLEENFELEEDMVALDGVVVTANRNETARRLAPTLVKVVTPKLFEQTEGNRRFGYVPSGRSMQHTAAGRGTAHGHLPCPGHTEGNGTHLHHALLHGRPKHRKDCRYHRMSGGNGKKPPLAGERQNGFLLKTKWL